MASVLAGITTSIDGYITGPDDGPGKGLGESGERLHYWVFGGPWTYAEEERRAPAGEDAAWLTDTMSRIGAVVGGRGTYEAARHCGDENPSRTVRKRSRGGAFTFVSGVQAAVEPSRRRAARTSMIIIAPVVMGAGKRLFDEFSQSLDLEHLGVRQSPHATFIQYRVQRP